MFDLTTFVILLFAFDCLDPARAAVFHTGWFVESLITQTLVIHVIRTARIAFIESRASLPLTVTTVAVVLIGLWLPGSWLGDVVGFVPLPLGYWPFLAVTVVAYGLTVSFVKRWLIGRGWIG